MNPQPHVSTRPVPGCASLALQAHPSTSRQVIHLGGHPLDTLPSRLRLRAGKELAVPRALAQPHVLLTGLATCRRPGDAPEALELLQPGDLVGLENFQRRSGEQRIQALADCELAPLRRMSDAEWRELLLHALISRQGRPGLASLRVGAVGERVRRLLLMLAPSGGSDGPSEDGAALCELPALATLAAITASTHETVCRVVSHLRRHGLLEDAGDRKVRLMADLQLSSGELPGGATSSRSRGKA